MPGLDVIGCSGMVVCHHHNELLVSCGPGTPKACHLCVSMLHLSNMSSLVVGYYQDHIVVFSL